MSDHEPCGLCGDPEGVRFPIPGRAHDCILCPWCVKAAVKAHAARGAARWAATRKALTDTTFTGIVGVDAGPEGKP